MMVRQIPDEPTPGRYEVRGYTSATTSEKLATWTNRIDAERHAGGLLETAYSESAGKRYIRAVVVDTMNRSIIYSITRARKRRGN